MAKTLYKSIEDENGVKTLYLYNEEVEPQNGLPISVINISQEEWNEILKETNNRLVQMIENDPGKLKQLNELTLSIFRALIARQLNKK